MDARYKDNSTVEITALIDENTKENIKRYAEQGQESIENRLKELDKKWDVERTMLLNAALLALGGMLLYRSNKRWMILPLLVTVFLAQQAVQGWCPPHHVLKIFGMKTRKEIENEKFALKALRGDFNNIKMDIEKVWESVKDMERNKKVIGFHNKEQTGG